MVYKGMLWLQLPLITMPSYSKNIGINIKKTRNGLYGITERVKWKKKILWLLTSICHPDSFKRIHNFSCVYSLLFLITCLTSPYYLWLLLKCLCPWTFLLNSRFSVSELIKFGSTIAHFAACFCPLNLPIECWIKHIDSGVLYAKFAFSNRIFSLHWSLNGRHSVSNHQPHDCLLNLYSSADQRKHQSFASLFFVWGIHWWPVNFPHKRPVTRKIWFDAVIMYSISQEICTRFLHCCALLWLYIDWFSHIHQAYFTGTVAI